MLIILNIKKEKKPNCKRQSRCSRDGGICAVTILPPLENTWPQVLKSGCLATKSW